MRRVDCLDRSKLVSNYPKDQKLKKATKYHLSQINKVFQRYLYHNITKSPNDLLLILIIYVIRPNFIRPRNYAFLFSQYENFYFYLL